MRPDAAVAFSGPSDMDRPETIEGTHDLMVAADGEGVALRVDHLEAPSVQLLVDRIRSDQGRLDVLVNDIFGGDRYAQWDKPLWEHDLPGGLRMLRMGVETHVITSVTAVGVTPGWLRSERMMEKLRRHRNHLA